MKLKLKIKIRYLLINILSIIVLGLILVFAYFNSKLIETIISIICFYIFRFIFVKQYHAYTSLGCAIVSLVVYCVIILLELNLSESILFSVILTFIVNLISYYVEDYIDSRKQIRLLNDKFNKMKAKRLEELSEDELLRLLPDIKANIIHIVYGYIHRDKGITANEFAYKYNISEPLVYK